MRVPGLVSVEMCMDQQFQVSTVEHHHEGARLSVTGDVYGSVIPCVLCGTPP